MTRTYAQHQEQLARDAMSSAARDLREVKEINKQTVRLCVFAIVLSFFALAVVLVGAFI